MIYWSYMITFYLFGAGVSAGAMLVSIAADFIDPAKYKKIVRTGAYIAPFPIMAGMIMLIFDLERPWLFWLLLTTFKYTSIMSIGAWIITFFCAISIIYFMLNLQKDYLKLKTKANTVNAIKAVGLILSTGVALYTGLLLSTLTARPFWNTPMVVVLLFVSAVIDGLAAISLVLCLRPDCPDCCITAPKTGENMNEVIKNNNTFIHTVDFILLYLLLLCTAVFLIGIGKSTESAVSALGIVTSGRLSVLFWFGFVAAGVVIPFIAAAYKLYTKMSTHRPWLNFISALLALTGGYIVRSVIINAGQLTQAILF
ncbi:MAG: polysulfide reductase NrfD [Nitrospirae bacterium]|nr:polysulfide reductase NrfD [Nitrospirota bacterium]